jgi:predicted nucleotidyltransferase
MKLADALALLSRNLEALAAKFAVIGGLAASARGEVRFTRDIDVAVVVTDDAEAERHVFALAQRGYAVLATVEQDTTRRLATARLKDPEGVICDLVFSTSGIEREVVESAERLEVLPGVAVPTATAEALLAMKVLAATPRRPRDLDDIRAILRANPELDVTAVVNLLGRIEQRGYARGQMLLAKWERLRVELAGE